MHKITELKEVRLRTIHTVDSYGNRERDAEEWIFTRKVKSAQTNTRVAHYLIDMFICQFLMLGFNYFEEGVVDKLGFSPLLFVISPIPLISFYVVYYIAFEFLWQKTPGKFITKSVVIDEYGNKPELVTIVLRSLVRIVPFELLSFAGDKSSRGWHDKWSNTWVVSHAELAALKKLQAGQAEILESIKD